MFKNMAWLIVFFFMYNLFNGSVFSIKNMFYTFFFYLDIDFFKKIITLNIIPLNTY